MTKMVFLKIVAHKLMMQQIIATLFDDNGSTNDRW